MRRVGKSGLLRLLIHSVQEITNWERVVNSLLADDRADITLTGSNASLLSSELATLIAGRYVQFQILPLTYREFLVFRGEEIRDSPEEFRRYLRYGGLPGIHAFLLHRILRYDIKGLRHGLLGYRDGDISGVLENVVYLELLHRGCDVAIGKLNDREVDFIATGHGTPTSST